MQTTYRTGHAAKLLHVSLHHIRRLCEAGLIDAQQTQGNHWRIPASEVDRMRRDGVPPVPSSEPPPPDAELAERNPAVRPPSIPLPPRVFQPPAADPDDEEKIDDDADEISPKVQDERDNLAVAETRLKRRKVELASEEVEDAFRERERQRLAALAAERQTQAQRAAERQRTEWLHSWLTFAMSVVPFDAPADSRLEAHRLAERTLGQLSSQHPADITRKLVEAAVAKALQPYQRSKEIARAIDEGMSALSIWAKNSLRPTKWELKARAAAEAAIANSGPNASYREMAAAARLAVEPVDRAYQHAKRKEEVLERLRWWGTDVDQQTREEAVAAVRQAIESVPVHASLDQLERAKDAALAPYEAKRQRRRQAEQQQREAETEADRHLWRISSWFSEHLEYDDPAEKWQDIADAKARLRSAIVKRLVSGRMDANGVSDFIDTWLEEQYLDDDEDEEYDEDEDDE